MPQKGHRQIAVHQIMERCPVYWAQIKQTLKRHFKQTQDRVITRRRCLCNLAVLCLLVCTFGAVHVLMLCVFFPSLFGTVCRQELRIRPPSRIFFSLECGGESWSGVPVYRAHSSAAVIFFPCENWIQTNKWTPCRRRCVWEHFIPPPFAFSSELERGCC